MFECVATETFSDGTSTTYTSRLEILPQTLDYTEYHSHGGKPQLASRGKVLKVEPSRITLFDDPGMDGYIDRVNNTDYWKDKKRGTEEHGICKQVL